MKTINFDRFYIVKTLLCVSADELLSQGVLGREGAQCCNLTAAGSSCVVGLMVGKSNFEPGNSKMASDLSDEEVEKIFIRHMGARRYSEMSAADKKHFRGVLYYMQKIHDHLAAAANQYCWPSDRMLTLVYAGIVGQVLAIIEDEIYSGVDAPETLSVPVAPIRGVSPTTMACYCDHIVRETRAFVTLK